MEAPPSILRAFLAKREFLPPATDLMTPLLERPALPWTTVRCTQLKAHPFSTGLAPARHAILKVGSHQVEAFLPRQDGGEIRPSSNGDQFTAFYLPTLSEVGMALARFPCEMLRPLQSVTVEPTRPPWRTPSPPRDRHMALPTVVAQSTHHLSILPGNHDCEGELRSALLADSALVDLARIELEARFGADEHAPGWEAFRKAAAREPPPSLWGGQRLLHAASELVPLRLVSRGRPEEKEMRSLFAHQLAALGDEVY
jgi:hypothetical protein